MPSNLENSAVGIGLEMVSFHSSLKEVQCQGMFKLSYNVTHFTREMLGREFSKSSSYASTECEPNTSICTSWIQKRQGNQITLPISIGKTKGIPEKLLLVVYANAFACVDQRKLWKILQDKGIPEQLTCLLRGLHTG